MTFAFACYLVAALFSIGVGVLYLLRREFMPYHRVAAGMAWDELPPGLRVLLLAMLRGVGGGFLALGLAILFLLLFAYRSGDVWARWAIPLVGWPLAFPR